jgi:hypothetical protein
MTVQVSFGNDLMELKRCKPRYIPSYLSLMLLSAILIKFSYNFQQFSVFLPLMVLYTAYNTLFFIYQPYKEGYHNIGAASQLATLIYLWLWSTLKDYQWIPEDEDTEIFMLLILIIMLLISMVMAVIRILA